MTAKSYPLDEQARKQIGAMLDIVAVEKRACRACGRQLWMLVTKNGKKAPYTDDAINHFADCVHAERFRGVG